MTGNLRIDGDRLWASLMETAQFGATPKGGLNRQALSAEDVAVRRWFVAYGAGLLASVPFFAIHGVWMAPVARWLGGVDIAWLVGLAVGAGVYLLVSRRFDPSAEMPAIAASEAALARHASTPAEAKSTAA